MWKQIAQSLYFEYFPPTEEEALELNKKVNQHNTLLSQVTFVLRHESILTNLERRVESPVAIA